MTQPTAADSVGVTNPTRIPPMIATGMIAAGDAVTAAFRTSLQYLSGRGWRSPRRCRQQIHATVPMKRADRANPGNRPATNNSPTDASDSEAKMIIAMLGGKMIDSVDDAAVTAPAKPAG